MKRNEDIHIFQPKEEFYKPHEYQWALDMADAAEARHWIWNETNIDGDYHDLITKLTENELHGLKEVLKLFTLYETSVGQNYWQGIVSRVFPRPEIRILASRYAFDELAIHTRAYSAINDVLGELDAEHVLSYKEDPDLMKRMNFLEEAAILPKNYNALDVLKSLSSFVLIEGAVLSSSFAFLKHFKSGGKNLVPGIVEAVNYSLKDEVDHYTAGSILFRTLRQQAELTEEEDKELTDTVNHLIEKTKEHESIIIDKIFSRGRIVGITQQQLERFVNNQCYRLAEMMEITTPLEMEDTEIENWYWTNVNGVKLADFFSTQTTAYSRQWKKGAF